MAAMNELIEISGKYAAPVPLPSDAHKIVFALAQVSIEESCEIFLLIANNYKNGATKMLRGLYERALTIAYISQNPAKAQRFSDYGFIQEHRIIGPALKLTSEDLMNEHIKPASVADIRLGYEAHKDLFRITDCKKCGTTRIAHSWDIDITSMAEKVGNGFPQLLLIAYTIPTLQAHATMASALSRVKSSEDRHTFDYDANRGHEVFSFVSVFSLMVAIHRVSEKFLGRPIGEDIDRLEAHLTKMFHGWAEGIGKLPISPIPPVS
jgi:hypothetical protein